MINEHPVPPFLGQRVSLRIDRPGCPGFGHLISPEVPGQRACVLGASQPSAEFTGQVIAVIRQADGPLLCVAPGGAELHQAQIASFFPEPPHIRDIDCLLRKSCGVLAYRTVGKQREYLLVYEQFSQRWSLPKGHMEVGETEQQTALRELWEETGLTARLEPGKTAFLEYPISPVSRKQVVLFTGAVSGVPHARDKEIEGFLWVSQAELHNYLYPGDCRACNQLINQEENHP